MKVRVSLTLPSRTELLAGLECGAVWPATAAAARRATEAERDLEGGREALRRASDTVARVREQVQIADVAPVALEGAILAERQAALAIPRLEENVRRARAAHEQAAQEARRALQAEAGRRRDTLQRLADAFAPALEELRELEAALDQALAQQVPGAPGVPALEWPSTLAADGALRSAQLVVGSIRR